LSGYVDLHKTIGFVQIARTTGQGKIGLFLGSLPGSRHNVIQLEGKAKNDLRDATVFAPMSGPASDERNSSDSWREFTQHGRGSEASRARFGLNENSKFGQFRRRENGACLTGGSATGHQLLQAVLLFCREKLVWPHSLRDDQCLPT
jgi:hypothetical protein